MSGIPFGDKPHRQPDWASLLAHEVAVRFLQSVASKDWDRALGFTQISWRYGFDPRTKPGPIGRLLYALMPWRKPKEVRNEHELKGLLHAYHIKKVIGFGETVNKSSVFAQVPVKVVRDEKLGWGSAPIVLLVTLVRETGPFTPSIHGKWGANPVSATKIVEAEKYGPFTKIEAS